MNHPRFLAIALWLIVGIGSAAGQAPPGADPFDPFGGGAPASEPAGDPFGGAPTAGGAVDPFGGAGVPAEAPAEASAVEPGAAPAAPTPQPPAEEHPLVRAARESQPKTPIQIMRAVVIASDVGEHAAAKEFLQQLIGANLDAPTLAELVREYGTAAFVRIGRIEELAPEGRQFALAAVQAADAVARDPARLEALAEQVSDPSLQVQRAAIRELQSAGSAAVTPLVNRLADPSQADAHDDVRAALVYLGQPAVEPLLGVLEAPDAALRVHAMDVLGALRAGDALPQLVGPAVDPNEEAALREAASAALVRIVGRRPQLYDAREFLAQRAAALLDGELPRQPDAEGLIELWGWDADQGAAVPRRYPAQEAGAVLAARLAEDLYSLEEARVSERRGRVRRLYLQAMLHAARIQNGVDLPLPRGEGTAHAKAAALGAAAVEDALGDAIENDRINAAIGAVEVLGDIGSPALVHSGTARPAPLVAALRHKNQRLRFYAAEAISRINPTDPYPDSSRYIETLARIVRTEALPRVLVAHPRGEVSQTLAGWLLQRGFEAQAAYTGREAYEIASRHPDFAFLLLGDSLDEPAVGPLVELLRQDLRTANLPIAVMYRIEIEPVLYTSDTNEKIAAAAETAELIPGLIYQGDRLLAAQRIAAGDPLTVAVPQIHNPATLEQVIGRLAALADGDLITPRERIYFAQVALDAMARYAADPVEYAFYEPARVQDSLVKAVDQPQLSLYAIQALGLLGTAQAQRTLVDAASQNTRPLEVRQAAAAALREAVRRQHLQLTTQEILLQYDRYNLSATLDRPTQAVLGHVLDTLEGAGQEAPAAPPDDEEPPPS